MKNLRWSSWNSQRSPSTSREKIRITLTNTAFHNKIKSKKTTSLKLFSRNQIWSILTYKVNMGKIFKISLIIVVKRITLKMPIWDKFKTSSWQVMINFNIKKAMSKINSVRMKIMIFYQIILSMQSKGFLGLGNMNKLSIKTPKTMIRISIIFTKLLLTRGNLVNRMRNR